MDNVIPMRKQQQTEGNPRPYYATSWDDPVLFKIPSNLVNFTPVYVGHGLVLTLEPGEVVDCASLFGEAAIIDLKNRICWPLSDVHIITGDPRNLPLISWSYAIETWMKEDVPGGIEQ